MNLNIKYYLFVLIIILSSCNQTKKVTNYPNIIGVWKAQEEDIFYFTLYLNQIKNTETISLNYTNVMGKGEYVVGDVDSSISLGKFLLTDFKEDFLQIKFQNAEVPDSIQTVNLTYNKKDSSLAWFVLGSENDILYLLKQMKLKKLPTGAGLSY